MLLTEKCGNVVNAKEEFIIQCVDGTFALGVSTNRIYYNCVAYQLDKKYGIKSILKEKGIGRSKVGNIVITNKVINLVTKPLHYLKPTYDILDDCLIKLANYAREKDIKSIAMPKLGCGLDRLEWNEVRSLINLRLADLENLEVIVYSLD